METGTSTYMNWSIKYCFQVSFNTELQHSPTKIKLLKFAVFETQKIRFTKFVVLNIHKIDDRSMV